MRVAVRSVCGVGVVALALALQVLSLVAAAVTVYYVMRTGDSAKAVSKGQ